MGILKISHKEPLKHWTDLFFGQDKHVGFVQVTDIVEHTFTRYYGKKDIQRLIENTKGKPNRYISINAFEFGRRDSKALKQIRNIGIDIDQYHHGLTISEALDYIQALILEKKIPEPNMVLTSRGIQMFYTIQGGASPDMSWLAEYITSQYVAKLQEIGADPNAKDVSRLLRVPDSVNVRNNSKVSWEIWEDQPYTFEELERYCKPRNRGKYKGKKRRAKVERLNVRGKTALSRFYQTNHVRLSDLEKLLELREGDMTHRRNIFFYIYAYHQSLICNSFKDLMYFMQAIRQRVYSSEDKRMTDREFERTVKSAYEDATSFFEHFISNGYRVIYKERDGIIKPYKTSSLIERLNIKEHEQRELKRLHNSNIAKEKEAARKRQERREKGIQSRNDYEEGRKAKQATKLERLKELQAKHPKATQRQLASLLGVSSMTVNRLLKSIR